MDIKVSGSLIIDISERLERTAMAVMAAVGATSRTLEVPRKKETPKQEEPPRQEAAPEPEPAPSTEPPKQEAAPKQEEPPKTDPAQAEADLKAWWKKIAQDKMLERIRTLTGGKDPDTLTGRDAEIKSKLLKEYIKIANRLEPGKKPSGLSEVSHAKFIEMVEAVSIDDNDNIKYLPSIDWETGDFKK